MLIVTSLTVFSLPTCSLNGLRCWTTRLDESYAICRILARPETYSYLEAVIVIELNVLDS